MSAYAFAYREMRVQVHRLPLRRWAWHIGRVIYLLWEPTYQKLAWLLADKAVGRGKLWQMIHVREWQKSTFQSATFWLLATFFIYKLVGRLGHGVLVNIAVSMTLDWVVFAINKLWIWRKRQISVAGSGGRNLLVWTITFGLNILMAWLVISRLGTMPGRAVLGCYGVAMNPVMFKVRDRLVFAESSLPESEAAFLRLEDCKAESATRFLLIRTGA